MTGADLRCHTTAPAAATPQSNFVVSGSPMSLRKRGTDRRRSTRYEVVGSLRGIAVTDRRVRVHNLSATGALVESHSPVSPDSRISLRIVAGELDVHIDAQIRHVTS